MYHHTQRSPLHLLLYVPAIFAFFLAWQQRAHVPPSLIAGGIAVLMVILSLSFQTLTISEKEEHLDVRYGPLNLFGTKILFDDITHVERGKTSLIDGWGIHFIPFRGWTISLWGFDCAKVSRGDSTLRIGTDDAEHLVARLTERIKNQHSN